MLSAASDWSALKSDDFIYYYLIITVNVPIKQPTESVSYRSMVTDVLVYVP
jgi:hypothetical protein